MSEQLREFLTAWLAWVENGAPQYGTFDRRDGLCVSAQDWCRVNGRSKHDGVMLRHELQDQLRRTGLDHEYPFGEHAYFLGIQFANNHDDAKRLAWVREQLRPDATYGSTAEYTMVVTFAPGQMLQSGVAMPTRPVTRTGTLRELKHQVNRWRAHGLVIVEIKCHK